MKKIIMLLLAMSICFWLGQRYVEPSAPLDFKSASVTNKPNDELLQLEQRYQQLLSERASLVGSSSSHSSASARLYPKRVLPPMPTKEQIDKMVQDHKDFYTKVDVRDLYNVFSKKFEEESRNSEASAERESLIYGLHSKLPELQKYTLKSVECRDEHCRVEVFYQQLSDMDSVVTDFYDAIGQSEFGGLFLGGAENVGAPERNLMAVYIGLNAESSFYD